MLLLISRNQYFHNEKVSCEQSTESVCLNSRPPDLVHNMGNLTTMPCSNCCLKQLCTALLAQLSLSILLGLAKTATDSARVKSQQFWYARVWRLKQSLVSSIPAFSDVFFCLLCAGVSNAHCHIEMVL